MGGGGSVAMLPLRATFVGVAVTAWDGRYTGDGPGISGIEAPSVRRAGLGAVRGTSSLTSSSLFGSWLRSRESSFSSRSRRDSRGTSSSSGSSFTGFTCCANSGVGAGKFGLGIGRNAPDASSPGPRGL